MLAAKAPLLIGHAESRAIIWPSGPASEFAWSISTLLLDMLELVLAAGDGVGPVAASIM
jgi:hypothetical protein